MVRIEYFKTLNDVNNYYPDGVPSTVVAVYGDNEGVILGKSNNNPYATETGYDVAFGGDEFPIWYSVFALANPATKHFFDMITMQQVETADELSYFDGLCENPIEIFDELIPGTGVTHFASAVSSTSMGAFTDSTVTEPIGRPLRYCDMRCANYLVMDQNIYTLVHENGSILCFDTEDNLSLGTPDMTTKFPAIFFTSNRYYAGVAIEKFNEMF